MNEKDAKLLLKIGLVLWVACIALGSVFEGFVASFVLVSIIVTVSAYVAIVCKEEKLLLILLVLLGLGTIGALKMFGVALAMGMLAGGLVGKGLSTPLED